MKEAKVKKTLALAQNALFKLYGLKKTCEILEITQEEFGEIGECGKFLIPEWRYETGMDANTKEWWVYDDFVDEYVYHCDTEEEAKDWVEKKTRQLKEAFYGEV